MTARRQTIHFQWFTSQFAAVGAALALAACGSDPKPATTGDATVSDTSVADSTAGDTGPAADASADTTAAALTPKQQAILGVAKKGEFQLPGLSGPVQVVRTEGDVANIYAANRKDAVVVLGYTMARDRYFQMELTRRLGLGEISGLLGDAALGQDIQARMSGSTNVAEAVLARLTDEQKVVFDAFAQGINAYIGDVVAGKAPEPSEIKVAKGLLGGTAKTLMKPWDRRSVAGAAAAMIYNLGYETDDVGRTQHLAAIPGHYKDKPLADLRIAGALADLENHVAPIDPVSSAAGLGLDYKGKAIAATTPGKIPEGKDKVARWLARLPKALPAELAERAQWRDQVLQKRTGHDRTHGVGSNAWAVAGTGTVGGAGIVAGDGHLPLSVPSLFYQIGIDDSVFGSGTTHQRGLMIPGLPLLAVGTNGKVGWSQTQLVGDITDWYTDQLVLDDKGVPKATKFNKGGSLVDMPVTAQTEEYVIADVPVLGSKGRTEKWPRYITYDGRWIVDIEGPSVDPAKTTPAAGETVLALSGKFVVPKDTNADGVITAISFDFTGLDQPALLAALDGFGHSDDVWQFRDHTRKLLAYSQNLAVADSQGNVLYTGYQAVPCRTHLPRDADGMWKAGANPKQLIDGTQYTGFSIPTLADGAVDESKGADPTKCVVPFDAYPQSVDPPQGYIVTANNDPGNLSTDDNLMNDKYYIGGPWANGYRAGSIAKGLQEAIADKKADVERMAKLQAHNQSRLGQEWVPFLQAALDHAKTLNNSDKMLNADEQRLVDLYNSITPTVRDDAMARLTAWHKAGAPALSGVQTFYHEPAVGETEHAIATAIFNMWISRMVNLAVDDEGIDVWEPWGADARTRALSWMRDGRGPGNPKKQVAWNPATEESAFWDILDTPAIERSDEIALLALQKGLTDGATRYGSADFAKWIWGMKHGVHFDSILSSFFDGSSDYAPLTKMFSITPQKIPLMPNLPASDPRSALTQFPRGGDAFAVDAAGGMNSDGYGSGPVFRMIIAMGKDKTTGLNVVPGGQSGLTDSPFFDDQVRLWLGNQAWPLRFEVEDVVAGAVGREVYTPAAP
ncbi:MAG: penicillin acylase family protein [Deltaproteobacteria bacterium]|nr:penicillin acylase family protein [Deltaproteobacteria bacterium]